MAGGSVEKDWKLDGVDLMPYPTGKEKAAPHEALYWRFGEQWAIRKGAWKLVVNRIDGLKKAPALYYLKDDVGEAKDLNEKEKALAKDLLADWQRWNKEQKDPLWKPATPKKGFGISVSQKLRLPPRVTSHCAWKAADGSL